MPENKAAMASNNNQKTREMGIFKDGRNPEDKNTDLNFAFGTSHQHKYAGPPSVADIFGLNKAPRRVSPVQTIPLFQDLPKLKIPKRDEGKSKFL